MLTNKTQSRSVSKEPKNNVNDSDFTKIYNKYYDKNEDTVTPDDLTNAL